MHVAAKLVGIGLTVGAGALALTACANRNDEPETDPAPTPEPAPTPTAPSRTPYVGAPQQPFDRTVHQLFDKFDRDGRGGIGPDERTRTGRTEIFGPRVYTAQSAHFDHYEQRVGVRTSTWSIEEAARAADQLGNQDGSAQWSELASLAQTHDVDGQPGLKWMTERNRFAKEFGAEETSKKTEWTGTIEGRHLREPDPYPYVITYPPGTDPNDIAVDREQQRLY